ncbi:Lipase 1 precursor [Streptomyces sp. YIM 130001]|uniref:SGNH/GDSL hydrolase family protein n=1 Tax=Streptomyces sp. YIM 130001 TaxID=2259644 RepID=UPI000E64BD97|nr:SGNH/GDSL hydrolase family protein [Streptomyces sp. YIM 130001]RII18847.1 Lipase 1 precursor [Streptomyces sp. YIM 130001]
MRLSRITAYASSLLLAAGLTLAGAGAVHADSSTAAANYVALGDSYSSGVGAGDYDSGSGDCKRSNNAYPVLWAAANAPSSFDFTACSGAVTSDVVNNQLGPVNSATSLVSLSIGGNDAGFADVMMTCVLQSEANCVARVEEAKSFVTGTLPGRLDSTYSAISDKAPDAQVVVLGYPRFYQLEGSCVAGLTEGERAAINSAADLLNETTQKSVADHGFAFADVAGKFTGHEICSADAWLHSVNWTNIGESYHPTAAGQSGGYLPAFTSAA